VDGRGDRSAIGPTVCRMPAATPPGPSDPEPPVVPGYTLQTLLGRGGSGEVWRAVPRDGGRPVAVKVLVAGEPERQAREAALLGELDHPHLVRLHEVVHQPGRGDGLRVALVLDLLEGGSLAALLTARGRLRPGEVVTALAPVAAALAHAHAHGVVHGDLSPGNVVFTVEGRPVLTDLGVARVLGERAAAAVTPAYVDPIVARGGAPGPASDVFGVAAAAFHALTGIPPWNAAGPDGTLAVAASGELPDLAELAPDAPAELRAVVLRGLAADPGERGSAAAFALDLRHACRPEPVRMPAGGLTAEDLAGTGAGRRTELTHQVPGRRAHARPSAPAHRSRPGHRVRWAFPRWRPTVLRSPEPVRGAVAGLLALLLAVLLAGAVVALVRGAAAPASATAEPRSATSAVPAAHRAAGVPAAAPASTAVAAADRQDAPSSPAGWQQVVDALYARRARAFTDGAVQLLDGVYVPGSPLRAADADHLAALTSAGRVLRGFAPEVRVVSGARVAGDRAELQLSDSWPGYVVVAAADPGGPALATAPARPASSVSMALRRTAAGWRIETAQREG
jgi:eukaryotic-like serine/threonine-protein kinase